MPGTTWGLVGSGAGVSWFASGRVVGCNVWISALTWSRISCNSCGRDSSEGVGLSCGAVTVGYGSLRVVLAAVVDARVTSCNERRSWACWVVQRRLDVTFSIDLGLQDSSQWVNISTALPVDVSPS